MAASSSGFLVKSIILISLVILLMGSSMFFGKKLGKSVMAYTESNISENYPSGSQDPDSENSDLLIQLEGGRDSFGFDPGRFGNNQFQREWADPNEEQFSVVEGEPSVTLEILDETDETADGENPDEQSEESETTDGRSTGTSGDSIFSLGDSTVFRIQVGTFDLRENAESVWRRLTQAGYNASISVYTDNETVRYRVQVGNYHSREQADVVGEELRSMNFDAWVYQVQ